MGVGNPNPDYYGENRPGDNLYTDSIVALDANTGELRWHYQFTPHDVNDWDANQIPVLANIDWQGEPRRVVMVGNRNGFFYVLDRVTGEFLLGEPLLLLLGPGKLGLMVDRSCSMTVRRVAYLILGVQPIFIRPRSIPGSIFYPHGP